MIIVTVLRLRQAVIDAIPAQMHTGLATAVGVFIGLIGCRPPGSLPGCGHTVATSAIDQAMLAGSSSNSSPACALGAAESDHGRHHGVAGPQRHPAVPVPLINLCQAVEENVAHDRPAADTTHRRPGRTTR